MPTIALFGAGGKMGCRITDNLRKSDYPTFYVEVSEAGIAHLAERGLSPTPQEQAVAAAEVVIREAMDEAIRRGVPAEAARDFLLGHINVDIGILFGYINAQFSDGAKAAIERAKQAIFRDDWKKVFEPANVLAEVRRIAAARATAQRG